MRKFNVISYTEYVCPCCGVRKVTEVKDDEKVYCAMKHPLKEMKKSYKTEIVKWRNTLKERIVS